ncbi:MAG: succinylglutamate desuccinylase/aspartoacylase family protein [Deltaproteobacteria bacterium]|nr:succinylglutamate desuccinylase/aspartoacylase family protein [Deltaproteobacteria bacterium]
MLGGLLLAPMSKAQQEAAWPALELEALGRSVAPGETLRTYVDLARTFGGEAPMLDTLLVVTRGVRVGPTLCLTAGIHGDELNGVEIAHRIYKEIPGSTLAGTLIAMPAVNIQGLRTGSRYLPDRRDLNRAFPGNPQGSLASRIAHSLYQGVIRRCDVLIDLHTGSSSRTNLPQIRTDLDSPPALALARSFGVGVVLHGRGPEGSLRRAVLDAGLPAVIYEAGEPLRFQEFEIEQGVNGVRNVMVHLGMIAGDVSTARSEVYRKTSWVRAGDAIGVYLTQRQPGEYLEEGDVLGTVTDPASENSVTIVAPRKGRIIGMAVPQLVLPGYGLFHLGFDPE